MAKRPYMKLWKSDFRDGAKALTRPAKLLYLEILMMLDDHGGSIPDDVHWIRREGGMHDIRQVTGPLAELKREGKLAVVEGRIVNERVSRDREADEGGHGGSGTGAQGAGGQGALPLLRTIAGGRLSPAPVDNHGDEERRNAAGEGHCPPTAAPLRPHCAPTDRNGSAKPLISDGFPRSFNHSHSHSHDHEVAAVVVPLPRARDGPASLQA